MDIDEVGPFLKSQLSELDISEEDLFKNALNFKVSKRLMKDLENIYNSGRKQVQLILDSDGKQHWETVTELPFDPRSMTNIT